MFRKVCLLFIVFLTIATPVLAYGPWDGQGSNNPGVSSEELEEIIKDLDGSIQRAIQAKAAHPDFLRDLQDYLVRLRDFKDSLGGVIDRQTQAPSAQQQGPIVDSRFSFTYYDSSLGGITDGPGNYMVSFKEPLVIGKRDGVDALLFPTSDHPGATAFIDISDFQAMTLDMWVYIEDWGPAGIGAAALISNDHSGTPFLLTLFDKINHLDDKFNDNALGFRVHNTLVVTPANSIQLHRWHHIAVIHNGQTLTILVDGVPQDLSVILDSDTSLRPPSGDLIIGNSKEQNSRFTGAIEQLRISSRARTVNEIQAEIAPLLVARPSTNVRGLRSETIAGTVVNYRQHEAVMYNWRYQGVNADLLTTYSFGQGNQVFCLTVLGNVEEFRFYTKRTPYHDPELIFSETKRVQDALFEVRLDDRVHGRVRHPLAQVVIRKSDGTRETWNIEPLGNNISGISNPSPIFVD